MKKLIKMYNEKYGNTLGVIDDDFNKEQMYRIYYFIKNNCDDEEIQARLEKIKLDKPKTLEQQLTKLESENNKVSSGTIDPTIKSDIANIKTDLGDEELTTVNKNVKGAINEVNAQYKDIANLKINKGEVSISDIDKTKGKLDQTYMSDEFLQQIAGNTPINSVPAKNSITDDMLVNFYIHGEIGKNLFNKNTCEIGKYINETGGTGDNADYCASDFIKVIPGETYHMTPGNSSNFQFCYYNANKEFVQYTTGGDKSFTIPQDCIYVRFTIKKEDLDAIQFEKGDIRTNYESYEIKLKNNVVHIENLDYNLQNALNSNYIPPLVVKKYDDGIIFGFKYNSNEDMRILIKPCGQSKLPQINNIYKLSNSNNYPNLDFSNLGTIFQNASSDWVGPYTVRSSNDDGDKADSWEFTGGWHGYNGDQTGEKTASNKSFKCYIDNNEILDDEVKTGNKLKIVVVNNIQYSGTKKADGTGREVLEETVIYNITQNNINVEVQIKALEQIKITKYYGLQTVNNSYNGQLLFNDDNMKKWTDCNNVKIDGGTKAESDCGEFKLKNNNDLLIGWIDKNYGLGKRKYVNEDKPVVWSADYNKTYMVLIDGNCDLSTNEVLYWRGGYKFISLD